MTDEKIIIEACSKVVVIKRAMSGGYMPCAKSKFFISTCFDFACINPDFLKALFGGQEHDMNLIDHGCCEICRTHADETNGMDHCWQAHGAYLAIIEPEERLDYLIRQTGGDV